MNGTFRKIVFWTHLSLGLAAGLFILNMAVSGIILSFEPQIVHWAEAKARRAPPAVDAGPMKLGEAVDAASRAAGKKPASVTLRSEPGSSITVGFGRDAGYIYVDPYTGAKTGEESKIHHLLHEIEDWHRWLGNKEIGKPITGAVALTFFFMILGGLVLWWRGKIWAFAKNRDGKSRDFNWHNVIGLWCAALLLVTTLTGAVMSYQWATNALYKMTGNEPPPPQQQREGGRGPAAEKPTPVVNWDAVAVAAKQKVPGWVSINFRLPQGEGPVVANIEEPKKIGPARRSQLTLDAATGEEKKWEPAAGQNAGRKLRSWIAPLHTGRAFGIFGQTLMAVSAAGAIVLVWTGLALAWRRFRAFIARRNSAAASV